MAAGPMVSFGEQLRRHREAAGLTQEELAEKAGLTAKGISALERGERQRPYQYTVRKLADALALAPQDRDLFEAAARGRGLPSSSSPPEDARPRAGAPARPGNTLTPLVGRVRELALLERHLAGDGAPVLLLAGEPGIGKSRLLREAMVRAVPCGWTALDGGCQRRGRAPTQWEGEPYAPLLQALERHLARQPPVLRQASVQGCAWLVRLLPELEQTMRQPSPTWTLSPEQEHRLTFGAVVRYLANVAGPVGTLLVLDDLHWAGRDALDLFTALVRSAPEAPLRVVGAYRNTEVRPDDPLATTLADLAHAGLIAHHTLVALAPEETQQLLDALLEGRAEGVALRERVVRQAEGVPFFVASYAQAIRAQALDSFAADATVPWDVAQSVRQRVAVLPEHARELLRVAAIVGREAEPGLLRAVVDGPEREVDEALEALCPAGLLREEGRAYQFAHDVIREVVEADVGIARRLVLHRRIGAALEELGVPIGRGDEARVERLAYHYSRSDARDKAVEYLEQAGDRAWPRAAYAAAEGYYREVVERLDEMGRTHDAARARVKLGMVLGIVARYDAALSVLEQAAETYRAAGDLEGLGGVTAQIATMYSERGRPDAGLERIWALLAFVEARGPSRVLAGLYYALAHLLYFSGRLEEALAATERVAAIARMIGDERLLAKAELVRGNELRMVGRVEEALPVMEEAIRLAEALGDQGGLMGALDNMAWVCIARGEFDAAGKHNARALAFAEQLGNPVIVSTMTSVRGTIAFLSGDWNRAHLDLEAATATARQIGEGRRLVYPLAEVGRLYLATGRWEAASRFLEECRAMAEDSGDLQALRIVQGALAELDLLEGRPAAAYARLAPLLDRPGMEEWQVTELLPLLARAHLALSEVKKATDMAAQAIVRARAQTNYLSLADALRVQGLVAIGQEQWDEAVRSLEEALSLTRRMGYPYGEARVLHVYGLMHAHKGETEPARERLEAALAIFRRLGARKDVGWTEQAIADLPQP